jgi:feruloyl esterase
VYPYPEEVRYSGSGSTTEASSFAGFFPAKRFNDDIRWAGFPFTSGYEDWCDLDGTGKNLVCVRQGEQGS